METRYIREFVILAESCSFQETADLAHVSQSSLTKHIHKIEEELGVSLFDRTTRTVKLNEYGGEFYKYAKPLVQICRDYQKAIYEMTVEHDNKIVVGFQARLGQHGVVEMLSDFSNAHGEISLKMTESNRPMELLRSRECDFVIASEYEPRDSEIKKILYRVDTLVAIFPIGHPLANETSVTIDQLRDEKFIMHEDIPGNTSMESRKFRKLCAEAGFEPDTIMTVSFTSNIVRLVGQALGIAVINSMHVPSDSNTNGKINFVPIAPPIPFHTNVLFYNNLKRTKAAQDFIKYIKAYAIESLSDPTI